MTANGGGSPPGIDIVGMSIDRAARELAAGRYSARELAEAHLARIATYNPGYNAIITPNPAALREADEIDRRRAAGEPLGPLAGIPIVVKDTIDMAGLPTTAGWAPLSARAGGTDLIPERDAPVVERMRRAGSVILGKTNVPVFSVSGENTRDSWAGHTYNAAAPTRAPGASSAGSATAVAASFAVLGLAEETGGSIQNPAAVQGVVGIKPSFALVPNAGAVPLGGSTRDVVGPIARTVKDAALALDVLAGFTPLDPKTVASFGRVPLGGYTGALSSATLRGKRLGLYGLGWRMSQLSADTAGLYQEVIAETVRHGAVPVDDPFAGSGLASLARVSGAWQYDPRGEESVAYDLQCYLARLGPRARARSLDELRALTGQDIFSESGPLAYQRDHPSFLASLRDPSVPPALEDFRLLRERYIAIFDDVMQKRRLDAMLFPHALAEAPLLHSSSHIIATTVSPINIGGFPAVTTPAGCYASGTPFGVVWVGRLWDEADLLALAHAFERIFPPRRDPRLLLRPATAGTASP